MMDYEFEAYGDTAVVDMAACEKANRVLQQAYPDHPWLIGVDHFAGTLHCRLMYAAPTGNNGYGFLLHLSTINAPDGEKKLRTAGGECLERYQLTRSRATEQSALRAAENGLILDNIVVKSRH